MVDETAQLVRILATKPHNLILMPRIHMVDGENPQLGMEILKSLGELCVICMTREGLPQEVVAA